VRNRLSKVERVKQDQERRIAELKAVQQTAALKAERILLQPDVCWLHLLAVAFLPT